MRVCTLQFHSHQPYTHTQAAQALTPVDKGCQDALDALNALGADPARVDPDSLLVLNATVKRLLNLVDQTRDDAAKWAHAQRKLRCVYELVVTQHHLMNIDKASHSRTAYWLLSNPTGLEHTLRRAEALGKLCSTFRKLEYELIEGDNATMKRLDKFFFGPHDGEPLQSAPAQVMYTWAELVDLENKALKSQQRESARRMRTRIEDAVRNLDNNQISCGLRRSTGLLNLGGEPEKVPEGVFTDICPLHLMRRLPLNGVAVRRREFPPSPSERLQFCYRVGSEHRFETICEGILSDPRSGRFITAFSLKASWYWAKSLAELCQHEFPYLILFQAPPPVQTAHIESYVADGQDVLRLRPVDLRLEAGSVAVQSSSTKYIWIKPTLELSGHGNLQLGIDENGHHVCVKGFLTVESVETRRGDTPVLYRDHVLSEYRRIHDLGTLGGRHPQDMYDVEGTIYIVLPYTTATALELLAIINQDKREASKWSPKKSHKAELGDLLFRLGRATLTCLASDMQHVHNKGYALGDVSLDQVFVDAPEWSDPIQSWFRTSSKKVDAFFTDFTQAHPLTEKERAEDLFNLALLMADFYQSADVVVRSGQSCQSWATSRTESQDSAYGQYFAHVKKVDHEMYHLLMRLARDEIHLEEVITWGLKLEESADSLAETIRTVMNTKSDRPKTEAFLKDVQRGPRTLMDKWWDWYYDKT